MQPNTAFFVTIYFALHLCTSMEIGSRYFQSRSSVSGGFEGSSGNGLLANLTGFGSMTGCGAHCVSRGNCLSFIVDNMTSQCQLFDRKIWRQEVPVVQPGAVYFQKAFMTCPASDGYIWYLNLCFKQYTTPRTWTAAHEQCQADGGLLFHISTPARNVFFTSAMNAFNTYHIGGFKQPSAIWMWTTGSLLSGGFTNMVASVSPGSCLTVDGTTWQWDAVDCDIGVYEYLCEIDVFVP